MQGGQKPQRRKTQTGKVQQLGLWSIELLRVKKKYEEVKKTGLVKKLKHNRGNEDFREREKRGGGNGPCKGLRVVRGGEGLERLMEG